MATMEAHQEENPALAGSGVPDAGDLPVVGITIGDAAGVGPGLIHEALNSGFVPMHVRYRVIGDADGIRPGQPDPESARRGVAALEEAVALLRAGEIKGLVTGPLNMAQAAAAGFPAAGQTEYLAAAFGAADTTTCLTGPTLTVGLVTTHIPLAEVPDRLDVAGIVRTGRHLHDFCQRRGYLRPRIGVAGLNPHAGENGHLGDEEIRIIAPAIAELEAALPGVFSGPHSPDSLFHQACQRDFHAVLCLYHDQALIPFKMVDFREGAAVTLGLPFPRTSPDHGPGFDIAGRGIARPDSFIAAIRLAANLVTHPQGLMALSWLKLSPPA
jgi:4-hydroxythreonine-4-phosphate dehydrogenase